MNKTEVKKAVVLLSGGVDSTTTLAIAMNDDFEAHALTFRYGQRHTHEIEAATRIARVLWRGYTTSFSTSISPASVVPP